MIMISATTQFTCPDQTLWFALTGPDPIEAQTDDPNARFHHMRQPPLGAIFAIAARLAHPDLLPHELVVPDLDCTLKKTPYLKAPVPTDFDAQTAHLAREIANKRLVPQLVVITSIEGLIDELTTRYRDGLMAHDAWNETAPILVNAMVADAVRRLASDLDSSGVPTVLVSTKLTAPDRLDALGHLPFPLRERLRFLLTSTDGSGLLLTDLATNQTRQTGTHVLSEVVDGVIATH